MSLCALMTLVLWMGQWFGGQHMTFSGAQVQIELSFFLSTIYFPAAGADIYTCQQIHARLAQRFTAAAAQVFSSEFFILVF